MTRWDVERAVMASDLPSPGRLVMLVLLTRADYKTAAIPAEHTPSLTTLAASTGYTRRGVTLILDRLERDGWIARQRPPVEQSRRGARTRYRVMTPREPGTLPRERDSLGVGNEEHKPREPSSLRVTPTPILTTIGDELHRQTGKTYDLEWCAKVQATIFNGQAVGNREAYARQCIRNDPQRYLPTSQPPSVREVLS